MAVIDKIKSLLTSAVMNAYEAEYGLPAAVQHDFAEYDDGTGTVRVAERAGEIEAYFSNAYRACALAKARPLAALPIHVYTRQDGVRVESTKRVSRALSRLLRTRWNPYLMATEGMLWLDMTKDALGNAYVRVEWDGGVPVALWPLSGEPEVRRTAAGPVFCYGGDRYTPAGNYLAREIVWVKSPIIDADGFKGCSLAELAANEVDLSINLEKFYRNLLRNGTHSPGWLETDTKLNQQDYQALKERMKGMGGIDRAGHLQILDNGLKYQSSNMSMVDMSLVDQEKWILQQLCRTLSVPPQEVFDLSNSTYSNIEQGAINFANKTLMPECTTIERAFSAVLWDANCDGDYVSIDMNGLMRGSYRERMEGYRIAINAGFYSPNDVRAKEDDAPFEGGDVYFRSSAYIPVDPKTGEELAERTRAAFPGGQGEGSVSPDPDGDPGRPDGTTKDALACVRKDMVERIRDRYAQCGDAARAREFAEKVLTPLSDAYAAAGIQYDMQSDIEELVPDEGH